jgi:hypothetical protein
MGFVQELRELLKEYKFWCIVYEYDQALFVRCGEAKEKRVRWNGKDLEEIVAEEKKAVKDAGGYLPFIFPFSRPKMPEGYKRSFITGIPKHPRRYEKDKILKPGMYFYFPFTDDILREPAKQTVMNGGNISVPTKEDNSKTVTISCNIRYEIMDLYRAWAEVKDYEKSLYDISLSILSECSRGKKYEDWKNPEFVDETEKKIIQELRKTVTEQWGLKIHKVYITDNVESSVHRIMLDIPAIQLAYSHILKKMPTKD